MQQHKELKELIYHFGLLPVIKLEKAEDALPLAKALHDGGLDAAEVTFRTDCAAEAIRAITKAYPDMLVCAGTVTTVDQVKQAVEAGAKVIVSPCFVDDVVHYCVDNGILVIPGCITPSEVQKAADCGLDVVKFFPAEANGGLKTIRAMASVFKGMRFMPTGGINPENLSSYLRDPNVIACGGSWMVPAGQISAGDFDGIRKNVRSAVFSVLNFSFAHVGINCDTADEGYKNIFRLADMFDLILGDTESSSYVGHEVEITKQPFKVRGPHGHLGYFTDNIERAVFYLSRKGVEFNTDSVKPYNGKMYVIYLKDYLAGFAIHIEERNDHNPPAWEHRDDVKVRAGWTD